MKKVIETVGIDVSKLTLDVYVHNLGQHQQFPNNKKGYLQMLKWLRSLRITVSGTLFCFEHTGWYCILLSYFLHEKGLMYCCVNPIEIKRSVGFRRGKSDKADSRDIAYFAWLRRNEIKPSVPPPANIIELQRMMSLREQLVKQTTALKNLRNGMLQLVTNVSQDRSVMIIDQSLRHLEKQIRLVEREMEVLIKADPQMNKNYKLSKTVKGVGRILAIQMLLHTHNYTRFENWRQFASYCGLVPYPYQSGTSIHGRNRIHPVSDKKMKSLLSMSACSAIQHDKELHSYYLKRVEEGKHKMIVFNIIRNKIVSRIFATVKRGTPYVELNQFVA
jgi:transposase